MKKVLVFALLSMAVWSCSKEPAITEATEKARQEALATDRGPNCNTPLCSLKVDLPYAEFSVFHDFQLIKNYTTRTWRGMIVSLECYDDDKGIYQNIMPGVWYVVPIEQGVQYQMNYKKLLPCTTGTLAAGNASFTVKTATTTTTFPLQTGTTAATNPDIVYFARYGCVVSEGEIE